MILLNEKADREEEYKKLIHLYLGNQRPWASKNQIVSKSIQLFDMLFIFFAIQGKTHFLHLYF